jgi:hypothetical protein
MAYGTSIRSKQVHFGSARAQQCLRAVCGSQLVDFGSMQIEANK